MAIVWQVRGQEGDTITVEPRQGDNEAKVRYIQLVYDEEERQFTLTFHCTKEQEEHLSRAVGQSFPDLDVLKGDDAYDKCTCSFPMIQSNGNINALTNLNRLIEFLDELEPSLHNGEGEYPGGPVEALCRFYLSIFDGLLADRKEHGNDGRNDPPTVQELQDLRGEIATLSGEIDSKKRVGTPHAKESVERLKAQKALSAKLSGVVRHLKDQDRDEDAKNYQLELRGLNLHQDIYTYEHEQKQVLQKLEPEMHARWVAIKAKKQEGQKEEQFEDELEEYLRLRGRIASIYTKLGKQFSNFAKVIYYIKSAEVLGCSYGTPVFTHIGQKQGEANTSDDLSSDEIVAKGVVAAREGMSIHVCLEYFRKAHEKDPGNKRADFLYGSLLMKKGRAHGEAASVEEGEEYKEGASRLKRLAFGEDPYCPALIELSQYGEGDHFRKGLGLYSLAVMRTLAVQTLDKKNPIFTDHFKGNDAKKYARYSLWMEPRGDADLDNPIFCGEGMGPVLGFYSNRRGVGATASTLRRAPSFANFSFLVRRIGNGDNHVDAVNLIAQEVKDEKHLREIIGGHLWACLESYLVNPKSPEYQNFSFSVLFNTPVIREHLLEHANDFQDPSYKMQMGIYLISQDFKTMPFHEALKACQKAAEIFVGLGDAEGAKKYLKTCFGALVHHKDLGPKDIKDFAQWAWSFVRLHDEDAAKKILTKCVELEVAHEIRESEGLLNRVRETRRVLDSNLKRRSLLQKAPDVVKPELPSISARFYDCLIRGENAADMDPLSEKNPVEFLALVAGVLCDEPIESSKANLAFLKSGNRQCAAQEEEFYHDWCRARKVPFNGSGLNPASYFGIVEPQMFHLQLKERPVCEENFPIYLSLFVTETGVLNNTEKEKF